MNPVLFEIGNITIQSYPAMMFLAWVVGITWAIIESPSINIPRKQMFIILILTAVISLLGSRLAHVLFNLPQYLDQPVWLVLDLREPGLYFMGGLVCALIWLMIYFHYTKYFFFTIADFFAPFLILGYAIARWGCFLSGCCYGKITEVEWGFIFPHVDYLPRHPTQLYASVAAIIIFLALRHLFRKYQYHQGFTFFSFLILYGGYRFINELFRVSEPVFSFFTAAQIATLIMIFTGVVLNIYFHSEVFLKKSNSIRKNVCM